MKVIWTTGILAVAAATLAWFWSRGASEMETGEPVGAMAGSPVELGAVRWGRDLPRALAESRTSGKPVLLLFQEVPG